MCYENELSNLKVQTNEKIIEMRNHLRDKLKMITKEVTRRSANHKKHCDLCDCDVVISGWVTHLKTKLHQLQFKLSLYQEKNNEPTQ